MSAPSSPAPADNPVKDLVLLVDDDPLILDLLSEIASRMGVEMVQASNIADARAAVARHPNLGVVLCDQLLPDGRGLDFFRELKTSNPQLVRLLITGFPETKLALAAINDGEIFRFVTKPASVESIKLAINEALERYHLVRENQRLQAALIVGNEELQKANTALHQSLSNSVKLALDILDRFDHVLAGHSSRVAKWAVAIGKSFALSVEQLDALELAARMHDIGLISVSRAFHSQQQMGWANLPALAQSALHDHPRTGSELVQFLHHKSVPNIILAHHEWFNGSGYPRGTAQEEIPFLALVLSVPDAYDEIPLGHVESAAFVENSLGTRFHPDVGRAFLRLLADRPDFAEREREVLISELVPGMKLTYNLFSATGILLAPDGQTLTPKLIQYIHQHNESDPLTQRIFVAV